MSFWIIKMDASGIHPILNNSTNKSINIISVVYLWNLQEISISGNVEDNYLVKLLLRYIFNFEL